MAARRHGPRLEPRDAAAAANEINGSAPEHHGQYLSLPSSPTSFRRPAPMSRRPSTGGDQPPDERSPLLTAPRSSRIRIQSAHGSPRVPHLTRNQSFAGR